MNRSPYDPVRSPEQYELKTAEMIDATELFKHRAVKQGGTHDADISAYETILRNKTRAQFVAQRHYDDVHYLLNVITHLRGY